MLVHGGTAAGRVCFVDYSHRTPHERREGILKPVGTLYVVATPIGNLQDITLRAIEVLRTVDVVIAEDTRHTRNLLNHFGIKKPMLSHHAHSTPQELSSALQALDRGSAAIVTDAGTPGISDPGNLLVQAAHRAGHQVIPIPGPSSMLAAISVSGLVPGPFMMLGFLPRSGDERRVAIARMERAGMPVVLFESPQRIGETLRDLAKALGDRPALVARELTKVHEEVVPGTLSSLASQFGGDNVKGECVVVVGASQEEESRTPEAEIRALVAQLRAAGMSASACAREVAKLTGESRSAIYEIAQAWSPDSQPDLVD